jgi:hypothetical protein
MYESNAMLKNRRTPIVSSLFDTINKMSAEETLETAGLDQGAGLDPGTSTFMYTVSLPNMPLKITRGKPILICTYQVRTDGRYPFIMFLLRKKEATFIPLDDHKNIKYASISYIQTILPRASLAYKGFYENDKNTIIILSAEETNIIHPDFIWATSYEIINLKKIMNFPVNPLVIDFFLANPEFLLLKDERNHIYESPMVGYKTYANTCDDDAMDIYRETIIPSLGKCYYIDINMTDLSRVIMRIAFFAGRMVLKNEKSYDSMLCRASLCGASLCGASLCGANQCYIIQNYDQHVVLSVDRPRNSIVNSCLVHSNLGI